MRLSWSKLPPALRGPWRASAIRYQGEEYSSYTVWDDGITSRKIPEVHTRQCDRAIPDSSFFALPDAQKTWFFGHASVSDCMWSAAHN